MLKKAFFIGLAAGASASRATLSTANPSEGNVDAPPFPSDEELVAGSSDLPEYFDSRTAWFGCGLTVLDQVRTDFPETDSPETGSTAAWQCWTGCL